MSEFSSEMTEAGIPQSGRVHQAVLVQLLVEGRSADAEFPGSLQSVVVMSFQRIKNPIDLRLMSDIRKHGTIRR